MKKCPICGRDVLAKRKDAKYCKKAACRKKAHLDRKEEATKAEPRPGALKASVVVTFPDGSRWLMELTPLKAEDEARFPSLEQVKTSAHEICSGSVPAHPTGQPAAVVSSPTLGGASGISSDQIPQAVAVGQPLPSSSSKPAPVVGVRPERFSSEVAASPPSTKHPEATPSEVRSALKCVELFFTDERGRRISFTDAVRGRGPDGWRVRRYARAALGFSRLDGYGLGGGPGAWHEHYPGRFPEEFGLDSDLGILYVNEEADQVCVAGVGLLKEVLGEEWRAQIRARAENKIR